MVWPFSKYVVHEHLSHKDERIQSSRHHAPLGYNGDLPWVTPSKQYYIQVGNEMLHHMVLSRKRELKHVACRYMTPPLGTKKRRIRIPSRFYIQSCHKYGLKFTSNDRSGRSALFLQNMNQSIARQQQIHIKPDTNHLFFVLRAVVFVYCTREAHGRSALPPLFL